MSFISKLIQLGGGDSIESLQAQLQVLGRENAHLKQKCFALDKAFAQVQHDNEALKAQLQDALAQGSQQEALNALQKQLYDTEQRFSELRLAFDAMSTHYLGETSALMEQINWLSGTIAHDLRAPLRAIDAYTFFLADDLSADDVQAHQTLAEIRRNGKRMATLVDGLLDYMRITLIPLAVQTVDLNAVVKDVIQTHFWDAVVHIEGTMPTIEGDRALLHNAFERLIDNAVKFSKPVAQPRVRVLFEQGMFQIRDNGIGFDEAHRSKLFKLFHRLHGNDEFEGEGIGLCIAHRIIERHKGQLQLVRLGDETAALFSLSKPDVGPAQPLINA